MIFFFMLILAIHIRNMYFRLIHCLRKYLYKYACTDVGQKELNIQYIMSHYDALNPRALKRQTMI
jgi:hypothetical protein